MGYYDIALVPFRKGVCAEIIAEAARHLLVEWMGRGEGGVGRCAESLFTGDRRHQNSKNAQ